MSLPSTWLAGSYSISKEWISKKTTEEKNSKFEFKKPALFSEVADVTIRIDLKAGNSLVIPGGWAYAAFSCTDSVVHTHNPFIDRGC